MSRIGNRVLQIPSGVSISQNPGLLSVKGPLGQIDIKISFPTVSVENQDANTKFIANQSTTDLATSQLSFENQFKFMVER